MGEREGLLKRTKDIIMGDLGCFDKEEEGCHSEIHKELSVIN